MQIAAFICQFVYHKFSVTWRTHLIIIYLQEILHSSQEYTYKFGGPGSMNALLMDGILFHNFFLI